MIKIYKTEARETKEISKIEENCWIHVTNPSQAELNHIHEATKIHMNLLNKLLDRHETSRIEMRDDATLIVLNTPVKSNHGYKTAPMGIILSAKYCITITIDTKAFLERLVTENQINTMEKTNFVIAVFFRTASLYLEYLKNIQTSLEAREKALYKATSNNELKGLLEIQKSLVYFLNALNSNEIVLERIMQGKIIPLYEEDNILLEDTIIENRQAISMTNLYQALVVSLTDSYGTIISNNLNQVMKFLAGITIVFSIPTMISSFMGMNVPLGIFNNSEMAFLTLVALSIIISVVVAWIFKRKNWL